MANIGQINNSEKGNSVRQKLNETITEANKVDSKLDSSKLNGGTTNQVLKKNSNADQDYSWKEDTGGAGFANEVHNASDKATPVDADEFGLVDSAASWIVKKVSWANIKATLKTYFDTIYATGGDGVSKYTALVSTTDFVTTAASTSTITMATDKTAVIFPGMAIRFTLSGVVYYAKCTAITSNLLTIGGAPLTVTAGALSALAYSDLPDSTHIETILIPGAFADGTTNIMLETDLLMKRGLNWRKSKAYCVELSHICTDSDSGTVTTEAKVNVRINGEDLLSADMAIAETLQTSIVQFNTANYDINFGEVIELKLGALASGTSPNHDALNLTCYLTFVYP